MGLGRRRSGARTYIQIVQTSLARSDTSTAWMDVARVVAMVLVVLDHAVIQAAVLARRDTTAAEWWVAEPLLAVSRLAVPIFIMVSGALLLDPARSDSLRTFAQRRLARVGIPLLFWAIAYLTFRRDVLDQSLSGGQALRDIASGDPHYHLYYLYIALGLYAITPFLRRLIATMEHRSIVILCGMAFLLGAVDQFLRTVLQVGSSNGITLFVDYVGFYLAGWLLRDVGRRQPAGRSAAAAVFALALVVLVTATLIDTGQGAHWFYPSTYLSPAVIVASIALFLLLQRARPAGRRAKVARRLSDLSLGTYLVHPMILDLIRQERTEPDGVGGLLLWVGSLTASGLVGGLVITMVARRIPLLSRVF